MAETLSPRPAATVITVRDGANGYEFLCSVETSTAISSVARTFFPAAASTKRTRDRPPKVVPSV